MTTIVNTSMVETTIQSGKTFFTSTVAEILYNVIGIIGAIGNLLVIITIASSKKLRKTYFNMFILNQSCIDFLVSIILMSISRLTGHVTMEGHTAMALCLIWQSRLLVWGPLITSTYNLVALTLERYTEVVHPIWHRNHFNVRMVVVSVVAIWISGIFLQGLPIFFSTRIINTKCVSYIAWPSRAAQQFFGITWVFLKLLIPLTIMAYAYGRIAFILHKRIKTSNQSNLGERFGTKSKDVQLARARYNTIKTLFIVAICFFICWVWNQIYFFMMNVGYPADYSSNFYHFTVYMVFINGCVNPFIYAFQYTQFQVVAKQLFCRWKGNNQVHDVNIHL